MSLDLPRISRHLALHVVVQIEWGLICLNNNACEPDFKAFHVSLTECIPHPFGVGNVVNMHASTTS